MGIGIGIGHLRYELRGGGIEMERSERDTSSKEPRTATPLHVSGFMWLSPAIDHGRCRTLARPDPICPSAPFGCMVPQSLPTYFAIFLISLMDLCAAVATLAAVAVVVLLLQPFVGLAKSLN